MSGDEQGGKRQGEELQGEEQQGEELQGGELQGEELQGEERQGCGSQRQRASLGTCSFQCRRFLPYLNLSYITSRCNTLRYAATSYVTLATSPCMTFTKLCYNT